MKAKRRSRDELLALYDQRLVLFETLHRGVVPASVRAVISSSVDIDPVRVARAAREHPRLSAALAGLEQGINDCIEMAQDLDTDLRLHLDGELRKAGLPPVEALSRKTNRTIRKAISRGRLQSDTEFHLVKSACDNLDSSFSGEERVLMEDLIMAYKPSPPLPEDEA